MKNKMETTESTPEDMEIEKKPKRRSPTTKLAPPRTKETTQALVEDGPHKKK